MSEENAAGATTQDATPTGAESTGFVDGGGQAPDPAEELRRENRHLRNEAEKFQRLFAKTQGQLEGVLAAQRQPAAPQEPQTKAIRERLVAQPVEVITEQAERLARLEAALPQLGAAVENVSGSIRANNYDQFITSQMQKHGLDPSNATLRLAIANTVSVQGAGLERPDEFVPLFEQVVKELGVGATGFGAERSTTKAPPPSATGGRAPVKSGSSAPDWGDEKVRRARLMELVERGELR